MVVVTPPTPDPPVVPEDPLVVAFWAKLDQLHTDLVTLIGEVQAQRTAVEQGLTKVADAVKNFHLW